MDAQALSATELRIIIAIVGVIVFALIYFFGRPRKPGKGRRGRFEREDGERVEPTLGDVDAAQKGAQGELDVGLQQELDKLSSAIAEQNRDIPARKGPALGVRPEGQQVDRIVTLFVAARPGETIHGASLIVAAEKAGLVFGDKNIFHRLVSGRAESVPILSMANMVDTGLLGM